MKYVRADDGTQIDDAFDSAMSYEGPVIVEAVCKARQVLLIAAMRKNKNRRIVTSPLEDQTPFMDREL